jgi:hypothetical protein
VLACLLLAIVAQTAHGSTLAPLPSSDYSVRHVCAAPNPGEASCLALSLEPRTAAARDRAHWHASKARPLTGAVEPGECAINYHASCFTPEDLRNAYFPGQEALAPASAPQTIALVDAYNDLTAEADLNTYSSELGLPSCTTESGCFKRVGESGGEASSSLPFPKTKAELEAFAKGTAEQRALAEQAEGWALETATDIEMAHAICHNCHILLVEASSTAYFKLEAAESRAVALNATEISNSWGGPEPGFDSSTFKHPKTVITASTGDDGYLNWDQYETREQEGSPYFEGASYPASSPHVVAVGGTSLHLSAGGAWQSESVWNNGGGGCSSSPFEAPTWQQQVADWAQVGCGSSRANADIAADADPATGVNVYDSTPYPFEEHGKSFTVVLHWVPIGGTSVASPIIASMFALAGGAKGVEYPAQTLYAHLDGARLHDVTVGGNGECDDNYSKCSGSMSPRSPLDCGAGVLICNAAPGYDGPTGVGTPNGIGAFEVTEGEIEGELGKEEGEAPKEEAGPGGEVPKEGKEVVEPKPVEGSGDGSSPSPGPTSSGASPGSPIVGDEPPSTTKTHSPARAARITALRLTARARSAVRASPVRLSRLAFSFRLDKATVVHAILEIRVAAGKRSHWHVLPTALRFYESAGAHSHRLHGGAELAPGLYRLVLTVSNGNTRSVTIRVG